jgi:hypothetical protein
LIPLQPNRFFYSIPYCGERTKLFGFGGGDTIAQHLQNQLRTFCGFDKLGNIDKKSGDSEFWIKPIGPTP